MEDADVIIIGGGPTGATAGIQLARNGLKAVILEKEVFPRFHVGESFLSTNLILLRELGLEPQLRALPHMRKLGAEFGMGDGAETTRISFDRALCGDSNETFNIERAPFDRMMLDAARSAGAVVRQPVSVRGFERIEDGSVVVRTNEGSVHGRYLFDATGQAAILGRHLGTRAIIPGHRKVAYFGHFKGVERLPDLEAGYPTIVICEEGWFWLIPLDEERTSIGLVMDSDAARRVNVPADQMLNWGMARCPLVRRRTARAVFPTRNGVIADFSFRCRPYAGPGYFLVGDAAVFLDPIFSTGICMGMMAAVEAADSVGHILSGRRTPHRVRKSYARFVHRSSSTFFRLVHQFYRKPFRDLFLTGQGPLGVDRAVITLLAGYVFPSPPWSVRWRMRLFDLMVLVQQVIPIVRRRSGFSLMNGRSGGNQGNDGVFLEGPMNLFKTAVERHS